MKISYSQCNTFKTCPMHWHIKYKQKYDPYEMGASLYFGSAVDDAVMALLEGKEGYMELFHSRWKTAKNMFNQVTEVFDNKDVVYSYADFDKHLIGPEQEAQLNLWIDELGIKRSKVEENITLEDGSQEKQTREETPVEVYSSIVKKKKNPYKKLKESELKYFNRASWLSLKQKGPILINAFKEQFLPLVTKVHATQIRASIKSDDGEDSIGGALDFIVDLKGYDKPVIIDLKTAGQPYKQEQIDLTEQLALYYAMKGEEYNTNLVGYVVLCKNIPKVSEAYCKKCGNKKDGRHKTCDAEIDNVRCGGEWDETITLAPEVQVMVQTKNQEDKNKLFFDYSNILQAMKNDIVYKNTDKCNNWYGGRCPYYDLCHNGSDKGLKKRG